MTKQIFIETQIKPTIHTENDFIKENYIQNTN